MFSGYNPFGPQTRIVSVFTGWFVCRKAATYEMACTAQGASFLHIDDKLVYSAGGWRTPQRRIRRGNRVALSVGLHKMTLHHVSTGGNPTTMVAWRGPGEKYFRIFPADLFTGVTTGTPGPMKKYGVAIDIDFVPVHAGEAFMNNRYFQRYSFKALIAGRQTAGQNWKWDFGDGDTSIKPEVQHIYLKPGLYTVTLASRTRIGQLKRTNRIYVNRPWERVTDRRVESIKGYATIVAGYDFGALRADVLAEAVPLFQRTGRTDALLTAAAAFIRRDKAEPAEIEAIIPAYADTLTSRSQPAAAVKALLKGTRMTDNPDVHVELLTRAGRTQLNHLGQTDEAEKLFTLVIKNYQKISKAQGIQDARFGIADVWRTRGDYDKARDVYARIKVPQRKATEAVLHRGDLALHVENYTRQRDFTFAEDYLKQWQEAFPLDKLEGYWSFLRAKLSVARKQYAAAAREAEILIGVYAKSNYSADLLMIAADAYGKLGKKEQVVDTLKRVVAEYPESSLAAEAARKLKSL
jgi:TolA-binding protein